MWKGTNHSIVNFIRSARARTQPGSLHSFVSLIFSHFFTFGFKIKKGEKHSLENTISRVNGSKERVLGTYKGRSWENFYRFWCKGERKRGGLWDERVIKTQRLVLIFFPRRREKTGIWELRTRRILTVFSLGADISSWVSATVFLGFLWPICLKNRGNCTWRKGNAIYKELSKNYEPIWLNWKKNKKYF